MTAGIYAIRNKVNGRRYIGQSHDIEARIVPHVYRLNRRTSTQPIENLSLFERDWLEYGAEAFEVDVLEVIVGADLTEECRLRETRERWYIWNTPSEYNKALKTVKRHPLKINYPPEKTETEAVS